jgi:hypothetical protein
VANDRGVVFLAAIVLEEKKGLHFVRVKSMPRQPADKDQTQ